MGTCLTKNKESSPSTPIAQTNSATPAFKNSSRNGAEPEANLKKEKEIKGHVKKEVFIIKHRKSHDDGGVRNSRSQQNAHHPFEEMLDRTAPPATAAAAANKGVVVRTSSCTKEEVDAILIQCGRLSRNSSGKQATSSSGGFGRRNSGSKRGSYDFDHCDDNDAISTEEDQKKGSTNVDRSDLCDDEMAAAEKRRHRQSSRSSSLERSRRRTPSREREQQQRSSSRERRVSRSPGRRSSETTTPVANARNSNNNTSSTRPGKMVSVPATVSSLVMDKSNNGGGVGGEFATTTGVKRIMVKRNVGGASPRSQSPARANGNATNANKILSENQQHPSLSGNSSRKAEHSPYRRNPLSEVEPNSLAFPHSTANNGSIRVQNGPKKEIETEANQKPNAYRAAIDKGVDVNCKTKGQQEEDVKELSSMIDNVVEKTVVTSEVDNLKPQILIRSRSSRRSRDLDLNPEALLNPPQSYTSLLLEDIQNFHQKNTPPVSLPACVTKACAILEAVADLNSNTSSNFSQHGYQSSRNEYNVLFSTTNDHGKRVPEPDTKDPIAEYESFVNDDVMEPSLHNYMTVNRDGSLGGVDMEDQESSGSNSFTQQQHYIQGISSSSWEPSSGDSKDLCTSRLNNAREQGQKSPLGLEGRISREAARDVDGARKQLNSKKNVCDHQHVSSRIGRGTVGGNKVLHTRPVVTAAEST